MRLLAVITSITHHCCTYSLPPQPLFHSSPQQASRPQVRLGLVMWCLPTTPTPPNALPIAVSHRPLILNYGPFAFCVLQ